MPPKAIDMSRISTRGVLVSAVFAVCDIASSLLYTAPVDLVDEDGQDQNKAYDDIGVGGIEIEERHAGLERLHQQGAQYGTVDRADATGVEWGGYVDSWKGG
jgi:hypothetical protein